MPSVRELLESSVLVIVQYHKAKLPTSPGTESDIQQDLLQKSHADMITELTQLIGAAVTTNSRDEARRPLMMYILHNIELLRSYLDSPMPVEEPEFILIKKQVTQYVVDIHRLLHLSQASELSINYNKQEIKLFGLMGRAWELYSLCTSGKILQTTLLSTLLLPPEASEDKTALTVSDLFNEHQRSFLTDQIAVFKNQQTELADLHEEVADLNEEVAALTLELQDFWKEPLEIEDSKHETEIDKLQRKLLATQLELQTTQTQLRNSNSISNMINPTRPSARRREAEDSLSVSTLIRTSAQWAANTFFEASTPKKERPPSVATENGQAEETFHIREIADWF